MIGSSRFLAVLVMAGVAVAAGGCDQVRGRQKIQEANKLYKDGHYKDAVRIFEEAEKLVPNFWVLWLNKGYTCKQMLIPGADSPENKAAVKCALDAFKRMQELKPDDARGEQLYIQTLFDGEEFETLVKIFEDRFAKNPRDKEAVLGLVQVYTKWNKVQEALEWYLKKAELQPDDAETQYAIGVFLWQQLMQKGGGPDKASFDPRPDPTKPKEKKIPPPFGFGDIVSQQRIDLADTGIKYLNQALALRPKYHEAMTYINLLNRQKAMAYLDDPKEWQKAIDEAEVWRRKSLEAQGKPVPPPPKAAEMESTHDEEEAADGAAAAPAKAPKKRSRKAKRK